LFIIGFANMGSVVYVTLYLQLADGLSPTSAGLHLMPMTFGMAIASITAGRLVSRLGRYKVFLVSGIVCAVTAMLLLADLRVGSPSWLVSLDILLLGLGLGQVMGIPALAVQNSVDRADMGAATSATTFTRSMGQAFGAAAFGAILSARLTVNLPGGTGALAGHGGAVDSGTLAELSADLRHRVIEAYVTSYDTVFLVAALVLALGLLLALRIPEVPLRGKAPLAPTKPLGQKPLGQE
jgi:MFS family permease